MKFNLQKFSEDIKIYRCNKGFSQSEFAKQLNLKNQQLITLLESGRRVPSKEVFKNYCKITGHSSDDYWIQFDSTPFCSFINKLSSDDKKTFESALEKISIREYLFALYDRVAVLHKE